MTEQEIELAAERMAREWAKRGIAVLMRRGLWVEPRGAAELLLVSVGHLANLRSYEDLDKQPGFCKYARRIWYSIPGLLMWPDGSQLIRRDLEVMDGAAVARATWQPELSNTSEEPQRDKRERFRLGEPNLRVDNTRDAHVRDPQ